MPARRRTATSNFGVGRRESHVADAFYSRFEAPELSEDERVNPHEPGVSCVCGDGRRMDAVADDSVALVVTSIAAIWLPVWQWDALGYHLPYVNFALVSVPNTPV